MVNSCARRLPVRIRQCAGLAVLLAGLLCGASVHGDAPAAIEIIGRHDVVPGLPPTAGYAAATHEFDLHLVVLDGTGWSVAEVEEAIPGALVLLAPCRLRTARIELLRVAAPARFHDFYTPRSRELARLLLPARPTVYFVADTRQRPAFDAEAIGRGNSRTRPELADSVWVTRATRDLPLALAHELAHVLMNSGEHPDLPGNLMRDETSAENTRLTEAQCARLRDTGARHGLLRRIDG